MCTTAQLDRRTVFNDTYFLTILLTEQCHSTQSLRLGYRHIAMLFQRIVGTNLFAYQLFYLADFFVGHFLEMREVETKRFGRNIRTFLFDMCAQYFAQCLMQQVSCRVVTFALDTFLFVDLSGESGCYIFRQTSDEMYRQVVFTLRIYNIQLFIVGNQPSGITYLSTHLCIERSLIENDLEQLFILLLDFTVTQDFGFTFEQVVTNEFGFAFFQDHPVTGFDSSRITGTFFLFLHFRIELVDIHFHAVFTQDQFSQVQRETVCII